MSRTVLKHSINGRVFKRTSERAYTHVVTGRFNIEASVAQIEKWEPSEARTNAIASIRESSTEPRVLSWHASGQLAGKAMSGWQSHYTEVKVEAINGGTPRLCPVTDQPVESCGCNNCKGD